MASDVTWHLLIALFIAHEIDAAHRAEWRMLPLLKSLPDRWAAPVFAWGHVPLLVAILALGQAGPVNGMRLCVAAFAVVHVWLHWMFRHHPENRFTTAGSWSLIVLSGLAGLAHVAAAAQS